MHDSPLRILGVLGLAGVMLASAANGLAGAAEDVKTAEEQVLAELKELGVVQRPLSVVDFRERRTVEKLRLIFDKKSWAASEPLFVRLGAVDRNLVLELNGLELDAPDFARFAGFANITDVSLRRCEVSDAGYKVIAGLPNLVGLTVSFGPPVDASLAHFVGHPKLRFLWLEGNVVTDAAVPHLRQMTNLDLLRIDAHKLERASVAALHRSLPQGKVMVTSPAFDVPVWKLDRSKAYVYLLPKDWTAQNRGLPHDVLVLPQTDQWQRNVVITDQPGDDTLAMLKEKYERDLPRAFKDFKLESSALVPSEEAPQMVRIIHTNTNPGVPVRQLNYIVPLGKRRIFVTCTVMKEDGNEYDKQFDAFVQNILPPDELK